MARRGLCRNLRGSLFWQPRVHVFSRSDPRCAGGAGLNGVKEIEIAVADDVALIAWLQGQEEAPAKVETTGASQPKG